MGRAGESALKVTHFLLNKCFAMDQINAYAKSGNGSKKSKFQQRYEAMVAQAEAENKRRGK